MTETPNSPPPSDLGDQVRSANAAIDRQQRDLQAAQLPNRPADRRIPALLAAVAFVACLVWRWPTLTAPGIDPELELGATIAAIDVTRAAVQAHWDSAGAPPATLQELGFGDLPFSYRASDREFTIAALSPFGDSVGYQSPTRAARPEGR